ncbi:MAG TPA: MarR family transcriptional regulator [Caldisericia bacterium]|nr:MarR family transcriptional regulator [Caldisericia bacterium]
MKKYNFTRNTEPSIILLRLVMLLTELDHKVRNYGTDTPLHLAEIHMIKAIKEHPDIHVTALADILNITKGAVSQMLRKLEKKDMVSKTFDPANQSRVLLTLTPKGETAYYYHEKLHGDFHTLVMNSIHEFSTENASIIQTFLTKLESRLLQYAEEEEKQTERNMK